MKTSWILNLAAAAGMALVSSAATAQTAAWNYFLTTGSDTARWYFDARSVERQGDNVVVWIKYVNDPSSPDSDGSYSTAQRIAYGCVANTSQILTSVLYDQQGRFMRTLPNPAAARPVRPNTVSAGIHRVVCRPAFPQGSGEDFEPVADIYAHAAQYWERQRIRNVDVAPK